MSEIYTVKEFAAKLKVHPETVRRWIRDGRIDAFNVGGDGANARYRIEATQIKAISEDPTNEG